MGGAITPTAKANADAQQKANTAAAQKQAEQSRGPQGLGFSGGSVTFDKQGNTIANGKIVQFAGKQARDTYLSDRGVGNTGIITNQAQFQKADFSNIQGYKTVDNPQSQSQQLSQSELAAFGKSGNAGQNRLSMDQIYRGSAKEDLAKQREAERASLIYPSTSNADYITGGKPESGVPWVPPLGNQYKNMGQGINNSLVRNSSNEAKVKASEAAKAAKIYPSTANTEFNPLQNLTDVKAQKTNQSVFQSQSQGKSFQTTEQFIAGVNNKIELGNAITSLSNKQIAEKNLQSEAQFKSYLHEGEQGGATFLFLVDNKQVGQTSGARSYYDFLKAQKQYGNKVAVETTYPQREKALSEAVGKNTDFYLSLSPAYWKALSESGYYTERNANKINSQLTTHFTAKNLALMQGNLYSELHGGEVTGLSGPLYIPPPESEVASFIKMPFVGQKVSTSRVPSTSWVNVAQFAPGLPIVDRLAGPASEVWVNLIAKGGSKIGSTFNQRGIKFRSTIQEKAMENQYNFPKPRQPTNDLIRPTNLKELEPVGLQVAKQTMGKRPPTALETALSKEPRVKENQAYTPSKPNNLPIQGRGPLDINFQTNTPVFKKPEEITSGILSPVEQANRERYPLMSNTLPEPKPKPSEQVDLFGKFSGRPPIERKTKPDSNLSPVSRQFFGVQFKGVFPESYLPPAAGIVGKQSTSKPIVNLSERGDYQDFRFRQFMESANTKGKFGFSIKSTQEQGVLPEFLNPLGRRGKPPVKTSYPTENIISRSEFVSKRAFTAEDFLTASGKKGSASTKPIGALGRNLTNKKDITNEIVFNTGNKMPSPLGTGETNYQLWRNKEFQKKNPEPISVGDIRFNKEVSKLPKGNTKSPVFSNAIKSKELKIGFRRTSKNLFESKPKEQPKKEFEFSNKGSSQQQSVLLRKPLTRRRQLTAQEQSQQYDYEFRPIPQSKSEQGTLSGLLSGSLYKSGLKQHQGSLFANLSKTLSETKPKSSFRQSPKVAQRLFLGEQQKQGSKQIPRFFQSPKQGTKPKQTQKQIPKIPTPQSPKQTPIAKQEFPPFKSLTEQPKYPKPKPTTPLWGAFPFGRKGKGKSGPTGLVNLGVNNIFSSSLSISVKKNQRYEF